ncbi:hypothetical protein D3C77_594150 [compost metagenome]
MPPSSTMLAACSGGNSARMLAGVPSFCCEARMILRSVSRFCRPSRSSTMNQPLACKASISMLAAPWVTLVEKELAGDGLYCPVWSRNP